MRQTQQSVLNGQAMVMIITFAAMLFTLDYDNVRVFKDNVPHFIFALYEALCPSNCQCLVNRRTVYIPFFYL